MNQIPLHHDEHAVALSVDESVSLPSKDFKVVSAGSGNSIAIQRGCSIERLKVTFSGSNNRIVIGRHCRVNAIIAFRGDGGSISLGKHVGLVEAYLHVEYGKSITIGEGCIFSKGLIIRTGDSHSVIDIASGKRLNMPASVTIDPWVWGGYDVSIMKGVRVRKNTVIGAGSIVNKSISESECIIAGSPAKIVRRGVVWDRRSLDANPPATFVSDLLRAKKVERPDTPNPLRTAYQFVKPRLVTWAFGAMAGASLLLHMLPE